MTSIGEPSPKASTAARLRVRAPWLPPATSTAVASGAMPKARRPAVRVAEATARLTGRPLTRYRRPLRPARGKARATRPARGAARRLATPRWESASISSSGRRVSQAARAAGPAT